MRTQMKYIVFVVAMMATACVILISGLKLPTVAALVVLVLAVALDFFTTIMCLRKGRKEGNPAIAFLFKKIGVAGAFALLGGMWVVFILFRWLPSTQGIQTAIALVYWAVPINNIIVWKRANRKVQIEGGKINVSHV